MSQSPQHSLVGKPSAALREERNRIISSSNRTSLTWRLSRGGGWRRGALDRKPMYRVKRLVTYFRDHQIDFVIEKESNHSPASIQVVE